MDLETLKAEAERLARPGVILREAGEGSPAVYWHGLNRGGLCLSPARGGRWLEVFPARGEYRVRQRLT